MNSTDCNFVRRFRKSGEIHPVPDTEHRSGNSGAAVAADRAPLVAEAPHRSRRQTPIGRSDSGLHR